MTRLVTDGEERVAVGDRVDRGYEVLGPSAFEEEARSAGAERPEHVVVLLEGGEDEDLGEGCGGGERAGGFDAVEVGHAHVH